MGKSITDSNQDIGHLFQHEENKSSMGLLMSIYCPIEEYRI